jgi:PAS domain S-box-containing protein
MNKKKDIISNNKKSIDFESFLGVFSTDLVNLPLSSIDDSVQSSLKKLVEFFNVDRCYIGELSVDQSRVNVSYFYSQPDIGIPKINNVSKDYLPFVFQSIKKNRLISFSDPSELPESAKQDREVFNELGIRSLLVIPLKMSNAAQFGLSLSTVSTPRKWEERSINQIKVLGNILTHVIQRKIALKRIVEENEWSEAVMEGMPQLTYVLDLEGRLKRWNKNAEHLLGYTAREMKDKFIGAWHSEEDLKRILLAVEKIIEDGRERSVEYSFITKSGEILPNYYGSGKLAEIGGEQYIIGQSIDISEIREAQEKITKQFEEIERLKDQLEAENIKLRHELLTTNSFSDIIGESDILKYILYRIEQVAPLNTTVLLEGETGTGKELFARAIHQKSSRSDKALIIVNCAALPASLIESELFGHERGAFTGASQKQIGRFELANGGTLFLDEIGEIPLELQAKLLRVLQEGEYERIGNSHTFKTDVRIIAATNRDLEKEIREGRFRQDLYYRLNVFPISIKPLRERVSDIPLLVEYFVERLNKKLGKNITKISRMAMEQLKKYDWPGNVRELENVIERAMILSKSSTLMVEKLKTSIPPSSEKFQKLADFERDYILKVLDKTLWRINGPTGAANILGMHPETLRSRIRKLNIERPT